MAFYLQGQKRIVRLGISQIDSDPPPWFDPSPRSDLPHSAHLSLEKKCTSAQTNMASRRAPTQNPPWMTNAQIQINDMFFV